MPDMLLLEAMAREEGWYVTDSRPARNCNPLDLEYCSETIRMGALKGDPRFAVFATARDGWLAAQKWLSVPAEFEEGKLVAGYCGATLEQAINRFAPPTENETSSYVVNVCTWTGLTPETIVTLDLLALPEGI